MHSKNSKSVQNNDEQRSFIEEARRAQIIGAAIEVLNEVGYTKASLAKIAEKCGMSTSLTLYHFKDKQSLMEEVMYKLDKSWQDYVMTKLDKATSFQEKLHTYIETNLAFMGTRPQQFGALIELTFNARDIKTGLSFRNGGKDSLLLYLERLLYEGQQNDESNTFDAHMMALTIRGGIDQYLGYASVSSHYELEAYTEHLLRTFDTIILKQPPQSTKNEKEEKC